MAQHSEPGLGVPADSTSEVGLMWKSAVARYEAISGVQVQQLAKAENVAMILKDIDDKEAKFTTHHHDGSKLDKFRTLVSQSLAPIQSIADIVAQATKTAYPPSEAIFAVVRYLISVSKSVSADYDKVAGFFEDLRSYLCRLKVLEGNVPPIPELKAVLVQVFTSILVLCAICTKYIRKKRVVKAFQTLISGEDADLKEAYDPFHKCVKREQDIVINAILVGVEQTKNDIRTTATDVKESLVVAGRIDHGLRPVVDGSHRMIKYIESQETAAERHSIVTWISNLDFREKQKSIASKRHRDTGQWFWELAAFQRWFRSETGTALWCHGNPGSGKTIMMSTAVTYIEENTGVSDVAIAYVYCDYKDPSTLSETNIWSSIVRQLVESCQQMPAEISSFREKYLKKRSLPTNKERISLMRVLSRLFRKTYILVDALDECPEENRDAFIALAGQVQSFAHLLITSRPNLDLATSFGNLRQINVSAHPSDIEVYLNSQMGTSKRMASFMAKDPSLKGDIIQSLLQKANGMFLLVHMQIEHLCNYPSLKKVRTSLDCLAGDMDVEPGDEDLDPTALTEKHILLSVTAGLLRVDQQTDEARLVHLTLHEYLAKKSSNHFLEPEASFALVCLTYLCFGPFRTGPCETEEDLDRRMRQYGLLSYASCHWGDHFVRCQKQGNVGEILHFLENQGTLASSIQALYTPQRRRIGWHEEFPGSFSPLHAAAYWGLGDVLVAICQKDIEINNPDSRASGADCTVEDDEGWIALHWAVINRYDELVKLLLESHSGLSPDATQTNKALILAAEAGSSKTTEMLLRKAVDIDWKDEEGSTALHWAVSNGHEQTSALLLKNKADANSTDSFDNTPLHWAIPYAGITCLLLEHGGNPDSANDTMQTPLHWSAQAGLEDVTGLLVWHGANTNAQDEHGVTPLHAAVLGGHDAVVDILLLNGANANVMDKDGWTPLHAAIVKQHGALQNRVAPETQNRASFVDQMRERMDDENERALLEEMAENKAHGSTIVSGLRSAVNSGYKQRVLALLDGGADINAQDRIGDCTALTHAAWIGRDDFVELLLENGADPNRPEQHGRTALHIAVKHKYSGIVAMLLDYGANVDARVHSWTPLLLAAKYCWFKIPDYLLRKGADVNAADYHGRTALHWAAHHGDKRLAQLLLERGADMNAKDRWGKTALQWAVANREADVAHLLRHAEAAVS
ncbi:hypothetical protein NCS52_00117200 [Fusarium sp. LHS14.1]|nr:hypothetical protein NCS52_00117200 [Fusarium sp. LHS14.1]